MRVPLCFAKRPLITNLVLGFLISFLSYTFQPLSPFLSIAHRGASAYAPENTMAAFDKAVDLGFDYIEVDIRMSKDEELVVIHDELVNRTTNGEGFIHDFTVKELKELDAGSWFDKKYNQETIPLLYEVIEQFGPKVGILIDMKTGKSGEKMVQTLTSLLTPLIMNGLDTKKIKVQSFNLGALKKFNQLCPFISTGILVNKPIDLFHLASYSHFSSFISVNYELLSDTFINQAKRFHYEIYSWTIKHQSQFPVMQKLSVTGIISNEEKYIGHSHYLSVLAPFTHY